MLTSSVVGLVNHDKRQITQVDGARGCVVPHHWGGCQEDRSPFPKVWSFGGRRLTGEHHDLLFGNVEMRQDHALVLSQQGDRGGEQEDLPGSGEVVSHHHPFHR